MCNYRFFELKNKVTGESKCISVPDIDNKCMTFSIEHLTFTSKESSLNNIQPKDLEVVMSFLGINKISELKHITIREMSLEEVLAVPEWVKVIAEVVA